MILKYISQLLKPTDTFIKIRSLKLQNEKQLKALKYAEKALNIVEIEAIMKLEPGTRHRFQSLYKKFMTTEKY